MAADTRALVVLVAGIGGVIALSAGNNARASTPSTARLPAGGASPGPSSPTATVVIADAQKWLNALGGKVSTDGRYGPKTRAAWAKAARARKLSPTFARVDGTHARVDQATARTLATLALAYGSSAKHAPEGDVQLGPITTIKTVHGRTTKSTDYTTMTPAERARWAASSGDYGVSSTALLTDEQAYALEGAQVEAARASVPGADAAQQERAKRAAARAAELLGRKSVATIPRAPSNPTVSADDQTEALDEDADLPAGVDAPPLAYVSPPTPINLEAARKEAPALAKHLRAKGRAGYSRQSVRAFQSHAGITVDGIYGPLTADALHYFGATTAPAAFFHAAPGSVTTYSPT